MKTVNGSPFLNAEIPARPERWPGPKSNSGWGFKIVLGSRFEERPGTLFRAVSFRLHFPLRHSLWFFQSAAGRSTGAERRFRSGIGFVRRHGIEAIGRYPLGDNGLQWRIWVCSGMVQLQHLRRWQELGGWGRAGDSQRAPSAEASDLGASPFGRRPQPPRGV